MDHIQGSLTAFIETGNSRQLLPVLSHISLFGKGRHRTEGLRGEHYLGGLSKYGVLSVDKVMYLRCGDQLTWERFYSVIFAGAE